MADIEITVTGTAEVVDYLNHIRKGLNEPGYELIRTLQDEAIDETERRWMANGDGEWAPLKSATTLRKLRKGGTTVALIDTGTMFSSLTADRPTSTEIRLRIPYGGAARNPRVPRYQQYGTSRIPARPMLKKTPRLIARMTVVMLDYIYKLIAYKEPKR